MKIILNILALQIHFLMQKITDVLFTGASKTATDLIKT